MMVINFSSVEDQLPFESFQIFEKRWLGAEGAPENFPMSLWANSLLTSKFFAASQFLKIFTNFIISDIAKRQKGQLCRQNFCYVSSSFVALGNLSLCSAFCKLHN